MLVTLLVERLEMRLGLFDLCVKTTHRPDQLTERLGRIGLHVLESNALVEHVVEQLHKFLLFRVVVDTQARQP
jgi:hypothetical protein